MKHWINENEEIPRIWHPYWLWEENKYNMWGHVEIRYSWLQRAVEFTSDHKLYGKWMMKVVKDWKYSCEHNLSNIESNRRAWLGHAAVAYYMKCPEDIVRAAWAYLDEKQQQAANDEADKAIAYWEKKFKKQLCLKNI